MTNNEERALRIYPAIDAYVAKTYRTDNASYDEDEVKDLLTDLIHFCDVQGINFEDNLRIARDNYEAEITAETEAGQ